MKNITKEMMDQARRFNENPTEKNKDFILKIQIRENETAVDKHCIIDEEMGGGFIFSVKKEGETYLFESFLDDAEYEILTSIKNAGYTSNSSVSTSEIFKIRFQTEEEILSFLETHIWSNDLGTLY